MREDDSREEFKEAWHRGDLWKMAYLANREMELAGKEWKTSPLRFALVAFVIAISLRVFREITHGSLIWDAFATLIMCVGGFMTLWGLYKIWFRNK